MKEDGNKEEGGLDNDDKKLEHRMFYIGWQREEGRLDNNNKKLQH